MTRRHDSKRVGEPVQVYLVGSDRTRLDRLAAELGATKSDVLRRGLEALERELAEPAAHPALRVIGIAGPHPGRTSPGYDVAVEHDRFLADSEQGSWRRGKRR